jgi:hypothetical protein
VKTTFILRTLLSLLALVLALPAHADTVVLHPCVISGTRDRVLIEKLRRACQEELERFELLVPPSQSQVGALLAKMKGGNCARSNESEREKCLGQLAQATQASMGLLVTVTLGAEALNLPTLSGLLVDTGGNYVEARRLALAVPSDPNNPGNPPPPLEDILRLKARELRKRLSQLQRVTAPAPPAASESAPTPTAEATQAPKAQVGTEAQAQASAQPQHEAGSQAQASAQPQPEPLPEQASLPAPTLAAASAGSSPWATWRKPATYASLGAGAVAAGVALFFANQSESNMRQAIEGFNAAARGQPDGVPVFPSESALQEQVGRYHQNALDQRLAAGISTGLSAALLGVGAWLWFTEPTPPAPGTASLTVGPSSIGVRVLTP